MRLTAAVLILALAGSACSPCMSYTHCPTRDPADENAHTAAYALGALGFVTLLFVIHAIANDSAAKN